MKRLTFSILSLLLATSFAFAGGMVHNTNQSAAWIRMLVRDASTGIDAVFYNPAGLTALPDGFHIQVNSQTAGQKRIVTSEYTGLAMNQNEFTGETFVPVLPSVFAVYKTGNLAVSGGFFVVGGGGSADFKKGLPSFESQVAVLPPALTAKGIPTTQYSADIAFTGSSAYFAYQANVSYKINDMLSVAVGGRYITAKNTYVGHLKDIMINPNYPSIGYNGDMVSAPKFFNDLAAAATLGAQQATGAATALTGISGAGLGSQTVSNALATMVSLGQMTQADADAISGGLQAMGYDPNTITVDMGTAIYQGAAAQYTAAATDATNNALATADKEVDVTQTGHAFTPIFGVNLTLLDGDLNIAAKYELATKMTVKNETKKDDVGMFPNGEETNADLPSFLSLGANYKAMDNLGVQLGFHYYGDLGVSYGKSLNGEKNVSNDKVIASNSYELALGLEYGLGDAFTLSAGFLHSETLPRSEYQSDLSYSLVSNTVGLGGNYKLNDNLSVDFGFLNTFYLPRTVETSTVKTTYDKTAWVGSIGINYTLGK